jgi:hypothetical protein
MTNSASIVAGAFLLGLLVLAGATGWTLMQRAAAMPEYTDRGAAERVLRESPPSYRLETEAGQQEYEAFKRDWNRRLGALLTPKWRLHDMGRGLLTLSACGWLAALWFGLWDIRRLQQMRTPRSALSFLLLGSLIWLAVVPV